MFIFWDGDNVWVFIEQVLSKSVRVYARKDVKGYGYALLIW